MENVTGKVDAAASLRVLNHSGRWMDRAGQLLYLIWHWSAHKSYLARLGDHQRAGLIEDGSLLKYKYIGNYLAHSRSRKWRRDVLLSNYKFLRMSARRGWNVALFKIATILWEMASLDNPDDTLRITLQPGRLAPLEGEFELCFTIGNRMIAALTFVFADGVLLQTNEQTVCVVGALQGGRDSRADVRLASKLNGEISPFTMLIIALTALAEALEVKQAFGVSSSDQVALRGDEPKNRVDYDAMWVREGASWQSNSFYLLQSPSLDKTSLASSRAHRRRAERKRERKVEIAALITRRAAHVLCVVSSDSASPATMDRSSNMYLSDDLVAPE